MKFYNVTIKGTVYESFGVEANNVDQAIESAKEDFKAKFSDHVEDDSDLECDDYCEEG
jgi:hypothetical protein